VLDENCRTNSFAIQLTRRNTRTCTRTNATSPRPRKRRRNRPTIRTRPQRTNKRSEPTRTRIRPNIDACRINNADAILPTNQRRQRTQQRLLAHPTQSNAIHLGYKQNGNQNASTSTPPTRLLVSASNHQTRLQNTRTKMVGTKPVRHLPCTIRRPRRPHPRRLHLHLHETIQLVDRQLCRQSSRQTPLRQSPLRHTIQNT
jgi:hypothetical protein